MIRAYITYPDTIDGLSFRFVIMKAKIRWLRESLKQMDDRIQPQGWINKFTNPIKDTVTMLENDIDYLERELLGKNDDET